MRLLTSAVLAANLLLCAVFSSSCKQKDWYGDLKNETEKISFSKGWIRGANYVDSCHNAGSINLEIVKLRHYKDSVEFAKLVDGVK